MKRHFLIIAASIVTMVVQSCTIAISGESLGGETVKGNGNIVTRNCDVNAFEDLSLLLPATVNFTISEDYTCTFRVDENLLEYLDIKVKEKELILERQQKHKNVNLHPTEFVIDITAPSLKEVGLAGSGNINMMSPLNGDKMEFFVAGSGNIVFKEAVNVSHLELQIAGSGDISMPDLACDKLEVDVAGSGNAKIDSGMVNNAEISIAGSGDCDLACTIDVMEADIAGSGDITANVSNKLTYSIIGSGDIAYYGNPVLEGDKVGGRVKALESPVR